MQHIIVDDSQAKIICGTPDCIEIRDRHGHFLGYVAHGFSDEDIAVAKERLASNEPRYSTEQVLTHLESLNPQ